MPKPTLLKDFIADAVEWSGRSIEEIAADAGFRETGILREVTRGTARIAPAKVPELARALGVNSLVLMRLVMEEDYPEVWDTIRDCGHEPLTLTEVDLVNRFRDATGEAFDDDFDEVEMELIDAVFAQIARRRGLGH